MALRKAIILQYVFSLSSDTHHKIHSIKQQCKGRKDQSRNKHPVVDQNSQSEKREHMTGILSKSAPHVKSLALYCSFILDIHKEENIKRIW